LTHYCFNQFHISVYRAYLLLSLASFYGSRSFRTGFGLVNCK
jgi:hypothetical protein